MLKKIDRNGLRKASDYYLTRAKKGEAAVFGICNMDGEVIRKRKLGGELVEDDNEADILIPEKLERLLFPKPVKVVYGGRGSGKTRTVASICTEAIRYLGIRALCMREVQNSITDSSHQELVDEIDRRKLKNTQFAVTDRRIRSKVSKGFAMFTGLLRNLASIKGKAGLGLGWCDEAENVSLLSWDVVQPTLRKDGSELYITFNPRYEEDPTWTEFVQPYLSKMVDGIYEDDNILVIDCNWRDNPWFTEKLRAMKDLMKERDIDRHNWIWEGQFNKKSDVQVFGGKWVVEEFEPNEEWAGPYFGADFGFSQDPATLTKSWIDDKTDTLYIEAELYKTGVELDDYPKFYAGKEGATEEELETWDSAMDAAWPGIDGAKKYQIMADEARPDIISYLVRKGFKIKGATKGPGSIEKGVTFIRSFSRIVIHTRCKYMKAEASLYRHKQDKLTENVLPDIIDKDNHLWDALRYSLVKLINQKKGGFFGLNK